MIVGLVPQTISSICSLFLRNSNMICFEITGTICCEITGMKLLEEEGIHEVSHRVDWKYLAV